MSALIFIVDALLSLLVWAFMLRVLLPLSRADARNPLSQGIIQITNPLVMPLRRVLPSVGRLDGGSLVALLLVQAANTVVVWLLQGASLLLVPLLQAIVMALIVAVLRFYFFTLFVYALMSWIAPGTYSPAASLLASLCQPILRPIQRLIPPIGGLDLSVVFALIAIQALLILLGR